MRMRELPFGARISDSFVDMLKRETAKAKADMLEVLPCLCAQETQHYEAVGRGEPQPRRIDFEEVPETVPTNRLAPRTLPLMLVRERVWVLCFDKGKHPPEATFNIDGLELHISEGAQAELKGATLSALDEKIVATYDPI
jgi:hypothetical protein